MIDSTLAGKWYSFRQYGAAETSGHILPLAYSGAGGSHWAQIVLEVSPGHEL